jgi:hypothetical protein
MPRKGKVKPPDIDVLARHYLGRGLSKHPDAAQHVANVDDIEQMPMWSLLTLAKKMGVDAHATIRTTEAHEDQLSKYSFSFPGFKGELGFDLTIAFLGKSITRKAKVVYEHTPEWEYYDLRKKALYTGWESSSYHIEVEAVPEEQDNDGNATAGTPYWVRMDDIARDDILPHDVWDAVLDAVDEQCKAKDAERRRAAAARQPKVKPKSRKHH